MKRKKDEYIISLFMVFKNGNYKSIRHFHEEYKSVCSVMTLMNKWKKFIPEYDASEGIAYKIKK